MIASLKDAIDQEIAFFEEIKKRLDALAQQQTKTAQQMLSILTDSYAQAYNELERYNSDLQALSDAMQGLSLAPQEIENFLYGIPIERRNASLYAIATIRAFSRPSLFLRVKMIEAKTEIMASLMQIDPRQIGIDSQKFHADIEAYGKFLIEFDECFLVSSQDKQTVTPWLPLLGAGLVGGYVIKDVAGERGLSDILGAMFGGSGKTGKGKGVGRSAKTESAVVSR